MHVFKSGFFFILTAAHAVALHAAVNAGAAYYWLLATGLIILLGLVAWALPHGLGLPAALFSATFVLLATVLAIFGAELGLAVVLVGCAICFIVARYRGHQDRIAAAARRRRS